MAKLQNVRTIDMTGGEITAIEYGGAVYAITKEAPKVGDIATLLEGHYVSNGKVGSFYDVTPWTSDRVEIIDEGMGGNITYVTKRGHALIYRKASETPQASAPFAEMVVSRVEAVEKRIDALEGAKDTETLVKGDRVLISGRSIYKALDFGGNFGKLVRVDYDGEHLVRVDGTEKYYFRREQLTKVAGIEAPAQPKTGDIVVITANTNRSINKVGDIGKVGGAFVGGEIRVNVAERGAYSNWTLPDEMRLATPAEIERYEKAKAQAAKDSVFTKAGRKLNKFSEGDVVRVTGGASHNLSEGDVGIVTELSNSFYRVTVSGKRNVGNFVNTHQLEIVCFAENRADLAKGAC